jgi:hypothetical protein
MELIFAVKLEDGGIGIIEVKSKTGSVKREQMSFDWIDKRVEANHSLKQELIIAFNNNKPVFRAVYKVDPEGDKLSIVRMSNKTSQIKREDLKSLNFLNNNTRIIVDSFTNTSNNKTGSYLSNNKGANYMAGTAHVDPIALRRLIQEILPSLVSEVTESFENTTSAMNEIKAQDAWNDPVQEAFEDELRLVRQEFIGKLDEIISERIVELEELLVYIEGYLNR